MNLKVTLYSYITLRHMSFKVIYSYVTVIYSTVQMF